jgi:hypothetical protein
MKLRLDKGFILLKAREEKNEDCKNGKNHPMSGG